MPTLKQERWALARRQQGLCARCGREPLLSTWLGERCLTVARAQQRVARGCRPYVPGRAGRPPVVR